jgi:hypothetical protein
MTAVELLQHGLLGRMRRGGEVMATMNSADLARRMGFSDADYHEFHRDVESVRKALRALGCPKDGSSQQARWIVDDEMAHRVAARLGRALH